MMDNTKMLHAIDRIMFDFNCKNLGIRDKERWIFLLITDRKQIYGLHLTGHGVLERRIRPTETTPPKRTRDKDEIVVKVDSDTLEKLVNKELDPMKVYGNEMTVEAEFDDLMLMRKII